MCGVLNELLYYNDVYSIVCYITVFTLYFENVNNYPLILKITTNEYRARI